MKRMLPYLMIVFFPYSMVLIVLALLWGSPYMVDFSILLIGLGILYLATLASDLGLFFWSLKKKRSAKELLGINLAVKALHVPAYVFLFLAGFASLITIFTAGFAVVFMILDGLTIVLSGLVGLSAVLRLRDEGKLTLSQTGLHGLLQFVFCADLASSILLYFHAKGDKWALGRRT